MTTERTVSAGFTIKLRKKVKVEKTDEAIEIMRQDMNEMIKEIRAYCCEMEIELSSTGITVV